MEGATGVGCNRIGCSERAKCIIRSMRSTQDRTAIAKPRTLPELLAWRVGATPAAEAYRQFNAQRNTWESLSWAETRCVTAQRRWQAPGHPLRAPHDPHRGRRPAQKDDYETPSQI